MYTILLIGGFKTASAVRRSAALMAPAVRTFPFPPQLCGRLEDSAGGGGGRGSWRRPGIWAAGRIRFRGPHQVAGEEEGLEFQGQGMSNAGSSSPLPRNIPEDHIDRMWP